MKRHVEAPDGNITPFICQNLSKGEKKPREASSWFKADRNEVLCAAGYVHSTTAPPSHKSRFLNQPYEFGQLPAVPFSTAIYGERAVGYDYLAWSKTRRQVTKGFAEGAAKGIGGRV